MARPQTYGVAFSTRRAWELLGAFGLVLAIAAVFASLGRGSDTLPPAETASLEKSAEPSPHSTPEELYSRVAPSVVTIFVKDEDGEVIASGSGFIVDESELAARQLGLARDAGDGPLSFAVDGPEDKALDFPIDLTDGVNDEPTESRAEGAVELPASPPTRPAYVLTNFHVIRSAAAADVYLFGFGVGTVENVVAEDEDLDLALLRVSVPAFITAPGIRLVAEDPRVFTTVYAIGSPRGLAGTASAGHVSGYRSFERNHRWLQTTAPISPGSSGGPLLLADGTLAGVTTMCLLESQNLNFAVPASKVREFFSTAAFRFRDFAAGRCIAWAEEQALRDLRAAAQAADVWQWEKDAAASLEDAWAELKQGIEKHNRAQCERAVKLATEVQFSLPGDYEYLALYVAGKASVQLAAHEGPESSKGDARTQEDAIRYRANKHAGDARNRLLQATSLAPDFAPAHERLARHYAYCGDWANALLAADEVVRLMPRCAGAYGLRADCYRELGQPESARDDLVQAADLSPRVAKWHFELAKAHAELGDYVEAVTSYENALSGNSEDLCNAIHFHLGLAYRKSGNLAKAKAEFTTAKALGWPAALCDAELAACGHERVGPTFEINARLIDVSADRADVDKTNVTVYVTKTGKKYHRDGCKHTSRSKISMPLDDAARQYGPCAHCRPPTP